MWERGIHLGGNVLGGGVKLRGSILECELVKKSWVGIGWVDAHHTVMLCISKPCPWYFGM